MRERDLEIERKRREHAEKESQELKEYLFNLKQQIDFEQEKKEQQNVRK